MKSKTSSGHDSISTKLIKQSINNIIEPLTIIINKSLSTGIIPNQLKIAKVIPIHKQSDKKLLNNYRPISLLPAFSKIFENVVFNRMINYMDSQNLFYKHQYGFRAKHTTTHPILHLLNNCAEVNNKQPKEFTLSIFCDLSKAFDVINHDILIKKLEYYGFRGVILGWLKNYLSDRFQYVEIENEKSTQCPISCGVPQGSILGPLLYLIYVNDIDKSTMGNILSFADDTSLFISDTDPSNLFRTSNIEIQNLYSWFCANRLSLNPTKTKFIIIKAPNQKCDCTGLSIKINGTPLIQIAHNLEEKSTKFLGIFIDESMTWKYHINHVNKKISRALFIIKQVKNLLPLDCLRTLYFALIHPHLSYGITAWGNASQVTLKRKNILQKRAIRTICRANYNSHTEPLFKQLNIMKLNEQYEYEAAIHMYTFVHNKLHVPLSFKHTFKFHYEVQSSHLTRQSSLIYIKRCDSNFARKLPLFAFPIIWNNWSPKLPFTVSEACVKKLIKRSLINSYMYAESIKCQNSRCRDCYI